MSRLTLTDDERDRVAAAYHEATERYRARKLAYYAAMDKTPSLNVLQCPPDGWMQEVADVILEIAAQRTERP